MNLANWITLSRLVLAVPVCYLFLQGERLLPQAIILGTVAGVTDLLDGWAARARHEVSELGKLLDPLADKVLIVAILVAFVLAQGLPAGLLWVYLAKELLQISGGVLLFRKKGAVISANRWGKAATGGFFLGFVVYLIDLRIGTILIGAALALSLYAFYSYYQAYRHC